MLDRQETMTEIYMVITKRPDSGESGKNYDKAGTL
jgi:hypothetical protein